MDLFAFVPDMSSPIVYQKSPVTVHVCREPADEDVLENIIKGTNLFSKFRRWFLRKRVLSRNHPLTQWCLKSTTALNYEMNRHLTTYPYMIHPFSSFRTTWEAAMVIFSFAVLLIIPVFLAFYDDEIPLWQTFVSAVNLVFFGDIIVWFLTGHYDYRTKVIVLDSRIVARKYLSGFFWIDILPALPSQFIDYLLINKTWQCAMLNLLKMLRMRVLIVYLRRIRHDVHFFRSELYIQHLTFEKCIILILLEQIYKISFQRYKILEMTVIITMVVHWAACMEYYIPLVVSKMFGQNTESWILSEYMKKKRTRLQKYYTCLNRAIISLVHSAHFLNVTTPEDMILNLILGVTGSLGFIYILAQFLQLITTFDSTTKKHLNTMQQLQEYMRYKELPDSLQRRLLIYYEFRHRKGLETDKRIIAQVSPYLREELTLHNYSDLINKIEIFKHVPEAVVSQLAAVIQTEIYLPNDVIVKSGSDGDALYFIASGTVAVYNNKEEEVCHLEDGAHFSEVALVMDKEHRIATLIAVETCLMYVLYRAQFQQVIAPYPNLLNRLQNVVLENLEKILSVDEASAHQKFVRFSGINISNIRGKRKDNHAVEGKEE